jgi:hypothetical protein
MDRQSKRHFLRTSEGFEVEFTIDATGEYYGDLRTKAPSDSTKRQYDRAIREIDTWLGDTFGRSAICLKKVAPAAIHRLKANKQITNTGRQKYLAKMRKKDRRSRRANSNR